MTETNLYEELKDILDEFKSFLDGNVPKIREAVQALGTIIPQINDLIDQLIGLMGTLKSEIEKIDPNAIPGLGEVSGFTDKVKRLLEASRGLLPDQSSEIDRVLETAGVVTSLPSLDQVKQEILDLIDAIVGHLNSLKSN